ncbi:24416_t:CDS:2, partial [Entrophospora sp. SA101]
QETQGTIKKAFDLSDIKLAVSTSEAVRKLTESLTYPNSLSTLIQLNQGDDIKMIFTIRDEKTQKGIQPHQAFLVLSSENNNKIQLPFIVQVRESGKASVKLSIPEELFSSPRKYHLDLIIGTFFHNKPIKYHIGTVNLDLTTSSSDEIVYGPRPEIIHIFKSSQKLPPLWLSYIFSVILLIPWMFLIVATSWC